MTNKIVILENSVELYEHFIDDDKWERTLAFPRGGVTYLVSNGTIKFFAYEDYLYRNCIISMQLPIYVVDEKRHIDGEYEDIEALARVLDPIFPSNDIDAELAFYLTIADAERLYQPIGDYLTKESGDTLYQPIGDYITDEELVEVLDDYYTKEECDERFQPIGDYLTKESADTLYQPIGDYLTSADTYTKQEIDDKLDDKLDISAYTPFDPSSYYTKIEVDNLIISGGSFDPNQYYNKSEADNRFALKSEIPSLSGYATQEWVLNQNYVTNSTLQQYITNLQQQITSIIQTVSGCCSQTGETLYRWITLTGPNDYICSGTTKYEKQQKQQSTDNGMTWVNVSPAEYQKGTVLETQSTDCGYTPAAQYRWQTAPSSDYICSGTTKYYKQYYQVSYDEGQTWQNVSPEQTRRGSVIQTQSTDCGYIEPQYRWKAAPTSDYLCSGTSKYYKVYYEVSYDNGSTWQHVQPEQTKRGDLIEANSTDCGYRTRTTSGTPYCNGYDKYIDVYKQVSTDSGNTWQTTATTHQLIEKNSSDCGYIAPQYRWYTSHSEYICSGTTKYQKQYYQVSYDGGSTWQNVSPTQTRTGNVIEVESTDCGYVPPTPKYKLIQRDGSIISGACNSDSILRKTEIKNYSANTVSAIIGDCVTSIGNGAFGYCSSLSSVTISNSVITISDLAFGYCNNLKSATIGNSVTSIGDDAFEWCSGLTSVVIPNSVTTISRGAFYWCLGLTSVTIGNNVQTIGNSAFNGCSKLTTVTLPSSLTSIEIGGFNQCFSLSTVTSKATTPPTMGDAVFDETNLSSIRVPSGSVNAYKAADGWKKFANIITAI